MVADSGLHSGRLLRAAHKAAHAAHGGSAAFAASERLHGRRKSSTHAHPASGNGSHGSRSGAYSTVTQGSSSHDGAAAAEWAAVEAALASARGSALNRVLLAGGHGAVRDFFADALLDDSHLAADFHAVAALVLGTAPAVREQPSSGSGGGPGGHGLEVAAASLTALGKAPLARRGGRTLLHEAAAEGNERLLWALLDLSRLVDPTYQPYAQALAWARRSAKRHSRPSGGSLPLSPSAEANFTATFVEADGDDEPHPVGDPDPDGHASGAYSPYALLLFWGRWKPRATAAGPAASAGLALFPLDAPDAEGRTALYASASKGQARAVEILLRAG